MTIDLPYLQLRILIVTILMGVSSSCSTPTEIERLARSYRQNQDAASLSRLIELIPSGQDTSYLKRTLGEPIDMGFDYRYLVDSVGANGCVVGAVFHLNDEGRVDDQWMGEICE